MPTRPSDPVVADVVVLGQIARDLVLRVDELPGAAGSVPVRERREMLGGKGANQAVGLVQLGVPTALLGVLGDDPHGDRLLDQARADGIDTTCVVRRPGTSSGLVVDIVAEDWHYLEDLPDPVLLTEADVTAAAEAIRTARATVIQLQQPTGAARAAAEAATGLVVLDGVAEDPGDRGWDRLLDTADVLRADAHEAELLAGRRITGPDDATALARTLLDRHALRFVALTVHGFGDVFVWADGDTRIPYGTTDVVDTTGAGDAMTAALTSVLYRGGSPEHAAHLASAAATATVRRLGGRPDLTVLT
jgi:ribokinase